ncbi:MAG: lasso peptide biosynthesis PqqD family chaperone [Candidatus Aminicenantes bacterium]|nr:lasso peptide biosynthesis PqqD family chaperone [Candidatus Aminicenantes bacterium]
MKSISLESVVYRTNEIVASDIDKDTVMMSIKNGKYYGLNDIGSRIWELLENPISVLNLCRILTKEFEVKENQCHIDVIEFLNILRDEKLISLR